MVQKEQSQAAVEMLLSPALSCACSAACLPRPCQASWFPARHAPHGAAALELEHLCVRTGRVESCGAPSTLCGVTERTLDLFLRPGGRPLSSFHSAEGFSLMRKCLRPRRRGTVVRVLPVSNETLIRLTSLRFECGEEKMDPCTWYMRH